MCSIIGYYQQKSGHASSDFLKQGLDLMRHRGPDAERYTIYDNTVALGNQRLAIIDAKTKANQPMETRKSALVFNGEIYNYLELREKLESQITFTTHSDTEVLLKGIEKNGPAFFHQLNGMFAFAFYNRKNKELWLVRDRFGVKPLHYTVEDKVVYFSSEIRPLITLKKNRKKNLKIYDAFVNDTATDFNQETFIQDIFQVQPGHYLRISGNQIKHEKWYRGDDFSFDETVFQDKTKTIQMAEDLLTDALRLRFRSDVPLAMTISGGLDGSTLYTLMKERLNKTITLFSVTNPGTPINEESKVKRLVNEYGDKVNFIPSGITRDVKKDIEAALKSLEFPSWDPSVLVYYRIYKHIHAHGFKIVIEGHGSDEQLGGYSYMLKNALEDSVLDRRWGEAWQLARVYRQTDLSFKVNKLSRPSLIYQSLGASKSHQFEKSLADSFDYRILPIVLRTFDRLTMASSIENRTPFMDYRVVEFFKKLPRRYKVSSIGSKAILREILKKYHKTFIYEDKRKIGFGVDLNQMMNERTNKAFFKTCVEAFSIQKYATLKQEALTYVTMPTIPEEGFIPIWKVASLHIINQFYSL